MGTRDGLPALSCLHRLSDKQMTGTAEEDLSTVSDRNLFAALDRRFAGAGGKAAYLAADGSRRQTYAELRAEAARYANALGGLGVTPGDRVTVQAEKSLAAVALYLATLKCGAIYQPLNTAYTFAE